MWRNNFQLHNIYVVAFHNKKDNVSEYKQTTIPAAHPV